MMTAATKPSGSSTGPLLANLRIGLLPIVDILPMFVADSELADVIATNLLNKKKSQGKIVRIAYEDQPNRAQIAVLVGKDSGIDRPGQLAGAPESG